MRVSYSSEAKVKAQEIEVLGALASVAEDYLRDVVKTISIPRHFRSEPGNNRFVAEWIAGLLDSYGYRTWQQGSYANVVATPGGNARDPLILIGAHYDSVPGTPGADDNASAVAAMLGCAKAISECASPAPVCFVAFNREEEGLIGSTDFVNSFLPAGVLRVEQAHILEMVGYCSESPGSQRALSGLPVRVPEVGNFLGVIGNKGSGHLVKEVLENARSYLPEFPVIGLKLYFGIEGHFPDLGRSDHLPFWEAGIPALMWTDTAEFRNPNYHRKTDTPDTLDYPFLRFLTQLLVAQVLQYTRGSKQPAVVIR